MQIPESAFVQKYELYKPKDQLVLNIKILKYLGYCKMAKISFMKAMYSEFNNLTIWFLIFKYWVKQIHGRINLLVYISHEGYM